LEQAYGERGWKGEHLGASRLVHAGLEAEVPGRVQDPEHADRGDVGGVLRHLEGDLDVALGGEVVDLVGLDDLQRPHQAVLVDEVPVVQDQLLPHVIDPPRVEGAAAAHEAVDLVALLEQKLGQVAAVLPGDAGDQCLLRAHAAPLPRS
jgi:hypothetical protein